MYVKVKCPVDGRKLGNRPTDLPFKSFCKDCGVWYIWKPGSERPVTAPVVVRKTRNTPPE